MKLHYRSADWEASRQVCALGDKEEQNNKHYPFKAPSDLLLLVNSSVPFALPWNSKKMLRTSSLLVFAVLLFALVFGQDHHGGEDSPASRYSAKAEAKAQNLTAEIRLKLEVGQGVNSVWKKWKTNISCS